MNEIATDEGAGQASGATEAGAAQAASGKTGDGGTGDGGTNDGTGGVGAEAVLAAIRFDASGLVAAIAQQHDTGAVLMMAWMNAEAVRETLATGRVCYFSRSRGRLWRKGESSGQTQHLQEMRVDCDGDALLLLVRQDGVACHTGRLSCFYRAVRTDGLVEIAAPLVSPEVLYGPASGHGHSGHGRSGHGRSGHGHSGQGHGGRGHGGVGHG